MFESYGRAWGWGGGGGGVRFNGVEGVMAECVRVSNVFKVYILLPNLCLDREPEGSGSVIKSIPTGACCLHNSLFLKSCYVTVFTYFMCILHCQKTEAVYLTVYAVSYNTPILQSFYFA